MCSMIPLFIMQYITFLISKSHCNVWCFWIFQDKFVNQLTILVKKSQLVELTVDEGWFSETEMKQDLKWTQFCPQ